MDRLFCKQGTMYLYRRKSIQRFHYRFIGHLHRFPDILSFHKLGRHAACSNCRAASKCLKLHIPDDLIFIDIQINPHDIAALRVSHCADSAGVLDFSYVSRMLKMIHNFLCIHNCNLQLFLIFPFRISIFYFCFFTKSSYNGDMLRRLLTISFKFSTT